MSTCATPTRTDTFNLTAGTTPYRSTTTKRKRKKKKMQGFNRLNWHWRINFLLCGFSVFVGHWLLACEAGVSPAICFLWWCCICLHCIGVCSWVFHWIGFHGVWMCGYWLVGLFLFYSVGFCNCMHLLAFGRCSCLIYVGWLVVYFRVPSLVYRICTNSHGSYITEQY